MSQTKYTTAAGAVEHEGLRVTVGEDVGVGVSAGELLDDEVDVGVGVSENWEEDEMLDEVLMENVIPVDEETLLEVGALLEDAILLGTMLLEEKLALLDEIVVYLRVESLGCYFGSRACLKIIITDIEDLPWGPARNSRSSWNAMKMTFVQLGI